MSAPSTDVWCLNFDDWVHDPAWRIPVCERVSWLLIRANAARGRWMEWKVCATKTISRQNSQLFVTHFSPRNDSQMQPISIRIFPCCLHLRTANDAHQCKGLRQAHATSHTQSHIPWNAAPPPKATQTSERERTWQCAYGRSNEHAFLFSEQRLCRGGGGGAVVLFTRANTNVAAAHSFRAHCSVHPVATYRANRPYWCMERVAFAAFVLYGLRWRRYGKHCAEGFIPDDFQREKKWTPKILVCE